MGDHDVNFEGGEELRKICATWFVSYAYYTFIDKTHMNWKTLKTHLYRVSVFKRNKQYHRLRLEEVIGMNNNRLNTNKIGVEVKRTKEMARELLEAVP